MYVSSECACMEWGTYGAVSLPERATGSDRLVGTILYLRSSVRERVLFSPECRSFLRGMMGRTSAGLSECCRFFGPSRAKVVMRD